MTAVVNVSNDDADTRLIEDIRTQEDIRTWILLDWLVDDCRPWLIGSGMTAALVRKIAAFA